MPWKGKPPSFFLMRKSNSILNDNKNPKNFHLTEEQWKFIYKYYPENGDSPYQLMVNLNKQALLYERAPERKVNVWAKKDYNNTQLAVNKGFTKQQDNSVADVRIRQKLNKPKYREQQKNNVQTGFQPAKLRVCTSAEKCMKNILSSFSLASSCNAVHLDRLGPFELSLAPRLWKCINMEN